MIVLIFYTHTVGVARLLSTYCFFFSGTRPTLPYSPPYLILRFKLPICHSEVLLWLSGYRMFLKYDDDSFFIEVND